VKPPFPYYGGKQRIAKSIIDLMPAHTHYVEPFFGGGSVLFAKEVSPLETVNDLDGRVVNFWRVLRERGEELALQCALTPHSREELAAAYTQSDDPLEDARRLFVALTQGRNATTRKSGWRNIVDPSNIMSMNAYLKGYLDRLPAAAARLLNVSIENRDAVDMIDRYGRFEGTLLYVDPPYLGVTRNSTGYAVEQVDEGFHTRMLDALVACKASVVLSGYASSHYEDMLSGWSRYEVGARANTTARTEVIWVNRPAEVLADAA